MPRYSTLKYLAELDAQHERVMKAREDLAIAQNQFDQADSDHFIVANHRLSLALERHKTELTIYKRLEVLHNAQLQTT